MLQKGETSKTFRPDFESKVEFWFVLLRKKGEWYLLKFGRKEQHSLFLIIHEKSI